jgi:hypothetical protein
MTNLPLIIVICALLSILPAGVVFMVVWARLMGHDNRISSQLGVKEDIVSVQTQYKNCLLRLDQHDGEIASLDDRLKTYNNRLTANNRHEKNKEKDDDEPGEIPGTEQQILPFANYQQQPTQPAQPQRFTIRKKNG